VIELSILVHPSDLGFLEPTLRHQLRHFAEATTIDRRVVVLDTSNASTAAVEETRCLVDGLLAHGSLDAVHEVNWAPDIVSESMHRWFGDSSAPPRAARQRPRYQYAHSLDLAQRDVVLHFDSDVLWWGSLQWLQRAEQQLEAHPSVAAIVPMAGAPQATTWKQWLIGRRSAQLAWPQGDDVSSTITTRHVIIDRRRIDRLLPLSIVDDEQFESSVSRAMSERSAHRLTTITDTSFAWHPHIHNAAHRRFIAHLIAVVEAGRYPFRRRGKPWDITTEGRRIIPWLCTRRSPPGRRTPR
jgi:hypothetical protein